MNLPEKYTPRAEQIETFPKRGFSVCVIGKCRDFTIVYGPRKNLKECLEFIPYTNCEECVIIHHHKHYSEILYEQDISENPPFKKIWKLRKYIKLGQNYIPNGKYAFYKTISKEKYLEKRLRGK